MKKSMTLLLVFSFVMLVGHSMAQCPGCITNMTCSSSPAYPTICPDTFPDGMAGQPYSEDISFWMPTNFDDPGSGLAVTLNQLTVVDMVGLPYGLDWQTNATSNNTYYPSSNPPATEYGCAKLCGTPVFAGTYNCTVYIHAEVGTALGDQSTDDSFVLPITILPDTSGTASFNIINSIGCGSVTASFETNLPSNGQNGFSYDWNFGNGLTSSSENPPSQVYNTPGTFMVTCSTVVDTLGFNYLNNVTVIGTSCTDFLGSPDLYIVIADQGGTTIFTSTYVLDTDPPVSITIPGLQLTNQNYTIEVWDDDAPTSGNDLCNTFVVNGLSLNGTLWNGTDGISYGSTHPLFTYLDTGYVTVYPAAPTPSISFSPNDSVCIGDTITLSTMAGYDYQWNNDTVVLLGGINQTYETAQSGSYWVMITDANGCTANSAPQAIVLNPLPAIPTFWKSNDTLHTLAGYYLQWYLNGNPITGAHSQLYVISASGYYSLSSSLNGCTSMSDTVYYIYSGAGISENSMQDDVIIMPNPFTDKLYITVGSTNVSEKFCTVYDVLGNCLMRRKIFSDGQKQEMLDFTDISAGVYFLSIVSSDHSIIRRLVKSF